MNHFGRIFYEKSTFVLLLIKKYILYYKLFFQDQPNISLENGFKQFEHRKQVILHKDKELHT